MTYILDDDKEKTTSNVKYLTPTEFEEEWERLFPSMRDKDLPSLIRAQAD